MLVTLGISLLSYDKSNNNLKHNVMKTLKSTLAVIALLFACVAANATAKTKPSQTDVLNTYIADVSTHQTTDLNKVLDDDMHFNLKRGENVNTLNKDELIQFLQQSTATNPPVKTDTTILQQDDNTATVKVVFKYDSFTRTDVVTLSKAFGWKVTNVDSSYN